MKQLPTPWPAGRQTDLLVETYFFGNSAHHDWMECSAGAWYRCHNCDATVSPGEQVLDVPCEAMYPPYSTEDSEAAKVLVQLGYVDPVHPWHISVNYTPPARTWRARAYREFGRSVEVTAATFALAVCNLVLLVVGARRELTPRSKEQEDAA